MSNALRRKKKKMEPFGYSKSELLNMQRYAKEKEDTERLVHEAYWNVRLVAYQLLHDDFGYGHKRIIRVEQKIDRYLASAEGGELTQAKMQYYLRTEWNIDPIEEANKIPFRHLFALVGEEKLSQQTGMLILASVLNYFSLLGVCLKTVMKMSANSIRRLYDRIRYYMDSIAKGYETMVGVASILYQECQYCDPRFVGQFYKV